MSVTSERALVLDRPCSTCVYSVRHLGERRCVKPLVDANIPAESIRYHLSSVDDCEAERRYGALLSRVLGYCGRDGRYWRAK